MKKDNDYITRLECVAVSSEIKRDLSAIKTALIGTDMQGGIVKKLNDLDSKVVDLSVNGSKRQDRADKKEIAEKEAWSREKVALIGSVGVIIGLIIQHFLDVFL